MSVSEDAVALRAQGDMTMALAAVEQIKNELFEAEGIASQILQSHPALADIAAAIGQAREQAGALTQAIQLVSGAFDGVANRLMQS